MRRCGIPGQSILRGAALILALAGVSACTPNDVFPPQCPQLSLVKDAADLTQFNGRGEDVTDLVISARLSAVPAQCKQGPKGAVLADLSVVADFLRGPAKPDRRADVGYFVAVADKAGRLLDKKSFRLAVEFPGNLDRTRATSEPLSLSFPVSETVHPGDYHIYVGFELTPEQLLYNRRGG